MSIFKFSPDLMEEKELFEISIGRQSLIEEIIKKVESAVDKKQLVHIVLVGQRGIGKTHTLLKIYYRFKKNNSIFPVRLSEEEYSVTTIEGLFSRILEEMGVKFEPESEQLAEFAISVFKKTRLEGKTPVIFVDNLQMLFEQMKSDLPKLRSILQEHNPFCIMGSALSIFNEISSHDEPFYNFFDVKLLKGLTESEVGQLIKKRLEKANKKDLLTTIADFDSRVKGIHILTGGSPRLVHSLCEILLRKSSLVDIEKNLLELLDQLTPYYQYRMESLPVSKRKLIDTLATEEGPMSPTELAKKVGMKPTIVVTQLRRLENEGHVESIKFRDKKGVVYQISETLYRIWREMRFPIGARRVKLFINFLKIWYSAEERYNEYRGQRDYFGYLLHKSKDEAKKSITEMCYLLETLPELQIFELANTVQRFTSVGDFKLANDEIVRAQKNNKSNNSIIQLIIDFEILFAQLILSGSDKQYGDASIFKMEFEKKLIELENKSLTINLDSVEARYWFHEAFHQLSSHFQFEQKYDVAEKYTDLSYKMSNYLCSSSLIEKARILIRNEKYSEALDVLNKIQENELNDESIILKIGCTAKTKNFELAYQMAQDYLKTNISEFYRIIDIFLPEKIDFSSKLIEEFEDNMDKLTPETKEMVVTEIVRIIIHNMAHSIENGPSPYIQSYLTILQKFKNKILPDELLRSVIPTFIEFSSRIDIVIKLFEKLECVFELNMIFKPLKDVIAFIETKNTDILENLHKEQRELVIDIIKQLKPDIVIPQSVYESL